MKISWNRRYALLTAALWVTVLCPAGAKESDSKWYWLSEDQQTELLASVPPKPAPGSAQDKADLQGDLKLQATRTAQDIAEAKFDRHFRIEMISNVLGAGFTKENDPATFTLLKRVLQDEYLLDSKAKKENQRNRPYVDHSEIKNLFEASDFSYPSGHSCGSYTLAAILSQLFPPQTAALEARADAVAHSRLVAGVHYPSDVAEGKILANALVTDLLANAAFQADLAAAKAELAQKNR